MEAIIGLLGTIVGASIAGLFLFLKDKQQQKHEKTKERKRLLLEKYEAIYRDLNSLARFGIPGTVYLILRKTKQIRAALDQAAKKV